MLNEVPTEDTTLEEVWERKVLESGNAGMAPDDLEQARYLFMMGAHAALLLIAVNAPSPATHDTIVSAIEKLNNEVMALVAQFAQPH